MNVSSAHADGGAWIWFEYRLPVTGLPPTLPRLSLRVWTDTRFSGNAGGLAQQFLRVGPVADITGWLTLALHGTIYADRQPTGNFQQEARLEIEPTFHARVWKFTMSDRNRLEYRWRETSETVRYRNQLRISYAPLFKRLIPFVWDEVLFAVPAGFNENRAAVGLGLLLTSNIRLETAYLFRTRKLTDWTYDHLALLYLSVGLPTRR